MPPQEVAPTEPPASRVGHGALLRSPVETAALPWFGFLLVLVLGYPIVREQPWIGAVTYVAVTAGGAALAWAGANRRPPLEARAWRLIALGLALSSFGDVADFLRILGGNSTASVSIADVGWLSSYVVLGLGIACLCGRDDDRGDAVDALLEAATAAIVGLLLIWYLVLAQTIADTTTPLAVRAIWSAYPVLDVWLLAMVVRQLGRGHLGSEALFATGVMCWLGADFAYLILAPTGGYSVLLDMGWMAAAVLMGTAAWSVRVRRRVEPAQDRGQTVSRLRLGVVMSPLLVPGVVEVLGRFRDVALDRLPLVFATSLLVVIVYLRGVGLIGASETARERLRSERRYYRALADTSSDAIVVVDEQGRIASEPMSLARILDQSGKASDGNDILDLLRPSDATAVTGLLERAVANHGVAVADEILTAPGETEARWLQVRMVDMSSDPSVGGIVVNMTDITARRLAEEQLAHQALHDGLTGLANRTLLRSRLDQALARARRQAGRLAVIFLDVDRFKAINDSLGHDVGDRVLLVVAQRLQAAVRSQDTVARLGGDEFVIMVDEDSEIDVEAEAVCERLLHALSEPVTLDGRHVLVTASLGLAIGDGETLPGDLLRDADLALYRAKAGGRNRWIQHAPEMNSEVDERLMLEMDLLDALEKAQFEIHYQPVVRLESKQVVGFEALLRWKHPTLGLLGPNRFVGLAEETGHIVAIGRWVIDHACGQLAIWKRRHAGASRLSMSVNVSARQLASATMLRDVAEALARHGVDPADLILEITETALIEDIETTTERLGQLRDLGVRLAIDDFGTGYSSLGYLRQFPVDILKIDRSFVSTISDENEPPDIVRGLLDLARTLRMVVVAEGVEHEAQRVVLTNGECELGQGYLFARPLDEEAAGTLVAQLSSKSDVCGKAPPSTGRRVRHSSRSPEADKQGADSPALAAAGDPQAEPVG